MVPLGIKDAAGAWARNCVPVLVIVGVLSVLDPPSPVAQVKIFLSHEEALRLALQDGEAIRPVALGFDAVRAREIEVEARVKVNPEVVECFQAQQGGAVAAYVCIDNMIGRSKYVTYFVRIEHPVGEISRIELMEHRESVGAIVAHPSFVRRFKGKTADDWMFVGIDFPRIAGSTLTQRALVDGSRKLLHIYDMYLRHLPLSPDAD